MGPFVAVYKLSARKLEIFYLKAMPFGATRSVYCFLRVAYCLWVIGVHALGIIWFEDFAKIFGALGIQIYLSGMLNGGVPFSNTEKRVADLKNLISSTLDRKKLTVHKAQKLRGKMEFADGQLMGL